MKKVKVSLPKRERLQTKNYQNLIGHQENGLKQKGLNDQKTKDIPDIESMKEQDIIAE